MEPALTLMNRMTRKNWTMWKNRVTSQTVNPNSSWMIRRTGRILLPWILGQTLLGIASVPALALDIELPELIRLKNGFRLIVKEDKSIPLCGMALLIHGGAVQESPSSSGVGALLSQIWQDCEKLESTKDIARHLENEGTHWRVSNDDLYITATVETATTVVPDVLKLFATWLDMREVPDQLLEEAREKQLRRLEVRETYPAESGFLRDQVDRVAFGDHPLGMPENGTAKGLRLITPATIKKHLETILNPSRACLVVVGDVKTEEILDLVQKTFGGQDGEPYTLGGIDPIPGLSENRDITLYSSHVSYAHARVAFRVPAVTSEDHDVAAILGWILGRESGSILHQRLVMKEGALSRVHAELESSPLESLLIFELTGSGPEIRSASRAVLEECARVGRLGVSTEDLESVRMGLKAIHALSRQALIQQAEAYGRAELNGDLDIELDYGHRLDRVNEGDIKRVARQYLDPKKAIYVEMLPPSARDTRSHGVEVRKLPGGITAVFKHDPASEVVGIAVNLAGTRGTDPKSLPGLAGVLEGYLAEGSSSRRTDGEIQNLLARTGAVFKRAAGGTHGTGISLNATVYSFDELLGLVRDVVIAPRFTPTRLARVIKENRETWSRSKLTAGDFGMWRLYEDFYEPPYGPTADQMIASLDAMTLKALEQHHDMLLRNHGLVIAVTGNLSAERVFGNIESTFAPEVGGSLSSDEVTWPIPAATVPFDPSTTGITMDRFSWSKGYDTVWVGFRLAPNSNERIAGTTVWMMLLGGLHESLIQTLLRQLDPGSEVVWMNIGITDIGGQIILGFRLKAGLGETLARSIKEMVPGLPDRVITKDQVLTTRKQIMGSLLRRFQDKVSQAANLSFAQGVLGQPQLFEGLLDRYNAIQPADLGKVAREIFAFGRIHVYEGTAGASENDLLGADE